MPGARCASSAPPGRLVAGPRHVEYPLPMTTTAGKPLDETSRVVSPGSPASPRARRAGESLLEWVERIDPEVARAITDVDRTLLADCLRLSPLERLRACSGAARALGRFRVAP